MSARRAQDEAVRSARADLPAPAYFNVHQAAAYISCSRKQLEGWRSAGSGPPFIKIGRHVRYSRRDLDEWMAAARVLNTAEVPQ